MISVKGTAEPGSPIRCGEIYTTTDPEGNFEFSLPVSRIHNTIRIQSGADCLERRFVCDFDNRKRYNFFIDDNIFFMTEIYRKKHRSIFDSFYLKFLRDMHEKYDFKVTLNMFRSNNHDRETPPFDLEVFPETYKSEFEDNAHWLRLAFHAYSEFPDNPYGKAFPEKLPEHYEQVVSQLERIAGKSVVISPVLMHFYEIANANSRKYIREKGMRIFTQPERYWEELQKKWGRNVLAEYHYGFDQLQIPLLFMCNLFPTPVLLQKLEEAYETPGKNFLCVGTHEQYSYPFYSAYIPEHFQRVEAVLRSLKDHGFQSSFFTETLLQD